MRELRARRTARRAFAAKAWKRVKVLGLALATAVVLAAILHALPVHAQPPPSLTAGLMSRGPERVGLQQPWFPDIASARRALPYTLEEGLNDALNLVHVLEIGPSALVTPVVNHLPACGSDFAIESNRNAYEGSIDTSVAANTFLKLVDIEQTGMARGRRDCRANMVLFGGAVRVSRYSLFDLGGFVAVDVRVAPQ